MSAYCSYCHAENKDTARFCRNCGRPIGSASGLPWPPPAGRTGLLPPNAVVNQRYLITRKVGQGGMAAVYDAIDNRTSRRVALKEMSDAALTSPAERQQAIAQFKREAQMLANLDHPNLPKVTDVFEYGGKHYLAMDFVDGRTTDELLKSQHLLPEAQLLPWVVQLCDVLHYLHVRKIIFRDLKPSNIMIDRAGQVKLIDFGIARLFKPGQSHDTVPMGTLGYTAPEQHQGAQSDARTDVYALGVTLYQWLTGFDPTISPQPFPPLRQLCPTVSLVMEQVVTRALDRDRARRWQDMAEIKLKLTGPLPAAPIGPGPGAQPLRTSRPTTRLLLAVARLSNTQIAMAGLALLVIVSAALWFGTPLLLQYPVIWNNISGVAIVAPLVYAAVRRPWIASIAHGVVSLVGAVIIAARRWPGQPYSWRMGETLIAILLSMLLIEGFVRLLPKVRGKNKYEAWQRELAWLCLMAVAVSILMVGIMWGLDVGLNPIMWIGAAVMGALGWFIGDSIQQYLYFKQMGIKRGRGG